jgi:hypothetical protein
MKRLPINASLRIASLTGALCQAEQHTHPFEVGHSSADRIPVCPKSLPFHSNGSRRSRASAYERHSPKFNPAGWPLPLPKSVIGLAGNAGLAVSHGLDYEVCFAVAAVIVFFVGIGTASR